MLVLSFHILLFSEELVRLERRQAWLDDDIAFEVEHALDFLKRHVEKGRNPGRKRFQEPDMRNRRSKVDVPHALAANLCEGDFNAALLTDNAAIFDALIFTAQTLIVLDRAKDAGTEQAFTLWLEGPVIDGFRLLDFAGRPGPDLVRAGNGNLDRLKAWGWGVIVEDAGDVLAHIFRSSGGVRPGQARSG